MIEDNPADVGLVREALDEHGVVCELTVVTDGERAIQFIEELDEQCRWCPDLVILDLKLPKREGHHVLERIRVSTQCPDVPIVILTSSDAKEDRDRAVKLGATRYIRKPDRLHDFILLGAVFKEILAGR